MKTTNKKITTKPDYIVDVTNCETINDIKLAFAKAKKNAGVPLTDENIDAFVNEAIEQLQPAIFISIGNIDIVEKKKPNIFKRFWNWLRGKK